MLYYYLWALYKTYVKSISAGRWLWLVLGQEAAVCGEAGWLPQKAKNIDG